MVPLLARISPSPTYLPTYLPSLPAAALGYFQAAADAAIADYEAAAVALVDALPLESGRFEGMRGDAGNAEAVEYEQTMAEGGDAVALTWLAQQHFFGRAGVPQVLLILLLDSTTRISPSPTLLLRSGGRAAGRG